MPAFDVAVAGLGPAGSYAAYKLASMGLSVAGYDPARVYMKACGDAVPRESLAGGIAEQAGVVVDEVDAIEVLVSGRVVSEVVYSKSVWFIINKGGFVAELRGRAEAEGAVIEGRSVGDPSRLNAVARIDARGPYSNPRDSIIVYRAIARTSSWPRGRAVIDFDLERVGFYWIFPAGGGRVNVGAGWLGCPGCVSQARRLALKALEDRVAFFSVEDERAAPLSLTRPPSPISGGVVRVGEAAGLVVSLSGEGIRPGVESSELLARAVKECRGIVDVGCIASRYSRLIKPLVAAASLSRRLLGIVARARPDVGEKLIESIPEEFWREFFRGRLDLGLLASSLLRRPVLAFRLARSLLSSRS